MNSEFNYSKNMSIQISECNNNILSTKKSVFKRCVISGFITAQDEESNTDKYKWFEEVFMLNIYSLSLLETIMVNTLDPESLSDVDGDIKNKTELIVKDIARRIISSSTINKFSSSSSPNSLELNLSKPLGQHLK
jgi:capsule polysaccharide export protein KpsE/RkpR